MASDTRPPSVMPWCAAPWHLFVKAGIMGLSEEKMAPTQSVDAMTAGCGLVRSAVASFRQGRNRSASPVEKMADEG